MELDKIIQELENWHGVRNRLNCKNNRQPYGSRKPLIMDTLPRAIEQLKNYRELLTKNK